MHQWVIINDGVIRIQSFIFSGIAMRLGHVPFLVLNENIKAFE